MTTLTNKVRDHTATARAAAATLAPELAAAAGEADRRGTLTDDLVARIRDAGLLRVLQPRALGGLGLAPADAVEVFETLARADASAGWTTLIGNGGAFAAWLDPAVARTLLGVDGDTAIASVSRRPAPPPADGTGGGMSEHGRHRRARAGGGPVGGRSPAGCATPSW